MCRAGMAVGCWESSGAGELGGAWGLLRRGVLHSIRAGRWLVLKRNLRIMSCLRWVCREAAAGVQEGG